MDAQLQELLELEDAGWRSLCSGTGGDFYGEIMTAEARMVLANGAVMARSDVIASLEHAPPWDSYAIEEPITVAIDRDVVTLIYLGTGRRPDGGDFTGTMSSTYVKEAGEWKLALYQQTPKR